MAFLSKREGLAERLILQQSRLSVSLTTATLILRMARLEIDRAEPDELKVSKEQLTQQAN